MTTKPPKAPPKSLAVTINANYDCNPPHGGVENGGEVTFNVAPKNGCLVFTDPPQAFVGEPTDHLALKQGPGNKYAVAVHDRTIYYCACLTGGTCDPHKKGGGNTIKVGSLPLERRRG
jgi:hypothetical protein